MNKSVRFLPTDTPFTVVHGSTKRGGCVQRIATPSATTSVVFLMAAAASSGFASPWTINPFPLFPFSLFQRPLRGVRGRQPPGTP